MGAKRTRKQAVPKAQAEPEKATLRWLKVHRFRHVEPCELHFSETYNVLLGLNGSGKTTLLELISAALRFNFGKMKKEAFFIEYELGFVGGTITASVRNEEARRTRPARLALAGRLSGSETPYKPSAELVLRDAAGKQQLTIRVDESGSEIDFNHKTKKDEVLTADDLYGSYFLTMVWSGMFEMPKAGRAIWKKFDHSLDLWDDSRRFDEALGFLRIITGISNNIALAKDKGTGETSWARGRSSYPIPRSILTEAERQSRDWGGSIEPSLTMTQEHVDFLSHVARMLGFEKVELGFRRLKTDVNGSIEMSYYGELKFMLQRSDGSVVPHTLLSYGQKRALSFLYYLAVNERTVIADELVDGLHHSWIVEAIEAIGDRQAFLASQNPLLLDYLEFDSANKVRQSFVQCRLVKHKKGERMIWSNMSEYDATHFFDAYQVGLQHVSEILRTKGLW
jgi:energy-coupling factor transporter ATP-binding protein EcfA2